MRGKGYPYEYSPGEPRSPVGGPVPSADMSLMLIREELREIRKLLESATKERRMSDLAKTSPFYRPE